MRETLRVFHFAQLTGWCTRDVSINVRLETEEAKAKGLAGHVCEVQLQLEEFALLKSRDGHKRYVRYRNFRAE